MTDKLKIAGAVLCIAVGMWAFYHFAEMALGLRALMVLGGLVLGGLCAWWSVPGKRFVTFAQEAWVEGQRVAWPSRQETVRSTLIVFAFVVVMSLFLFLVDKIIGWLVNLILVTN
ncbi:MAG: preprotein translocase subunit SecE [Burkholderiales bacterium]|jgi:preprotein translocase subunit SecE|nr:preprotein translocase subunit SecE [Burkholderiales bacterium]